MRVLVAIANHGTKNAGYLARLLEAYRSMTRHKVDLVVLSNIPKDLGPDVEVKVGAPISDPWSLPFGYKPIFADRADRYDLFIYSEDDTLITERNIDAFVRVTRILPEQYIAGFLRYEIDPEGRKYYSTLHAHYHWDPHSVLTISEHAFAYYSNEHSACFILTREQLKRGIASGGFMMPARKGRYDMLVTAATDPYTQCGMKKMICISHIDEFCLHHLPNVYCGKIGVAAAFADLEIEKLKSLNGSASVRGPLFDTGTKMEDATWDKAFYEAPRADILTLVPPGVRRVLSVGCGCGSTESELVRRGIEVIGIPLNCAIQAVAEAKGIRAVPPDFEKAKEALRGQQFDCLLFPEVLQHLRNPVATLKSFLGHLRKAACVIISVPNFRHASLIRNRLFGRPDAIHVGDVRSFEKYSLHFTTSRMVRSWLKQCGLEITSSHRGVEARHEWISRLTGGTVNSILSRKIVVASRIKNG